MHLKGWTVGRRVEVNNMVALIYTTPVFVLIKGLPPNCIKVVAHLLALSPPHSTPRERKLLQAASFLPSGASSILPKISKRVQMATKFILTVSRKAANFRKKKTIQPNISERNGNSQ